MSILPDLRRQIISALKHTCNKLPRYTTPRRSGAVMILRRIAVYYDLALDDVVGIAKEEGFWTGTIEEGYFVCPDWGSSDDSRQV